MIDLMKIAKAPKHHVRLTAEFRSDLQWWALFLLEWNGRSILPLPNPAHTVTSDASGSWGCGAVSDSGEYFQVQWPSSWTTTNIAIKEMVPVVISVAIWGRKWTESTLRIRSDNMAVVHALTSGAAKDPRLMHLLRCLHFFTARHQISICARHVPGVLNTAADALSRNKMSVFFQCAPQAAQAPFPVPSQLLETLIWHSPDWTSVSWRTFYLGQSLAPSTRQLYKSGQRRFFQFCQEATLQPFLLSEQLLSMFVAYLGKEGLSHQTIKSYLSAVRFLSISTGQGDPFCPGAMPVLQYVLRGIKRMPKSPPQTRLPVSPVVLRALRMQWECHASNCDFVMLWAACCVGFFGFLRAGEFTEKSASDFDPSSSLTLQDVAVDQHTDPSVVQIRLKQSKTDPFRHGIDIFLGRTNADLCPVSALLAYVAVRPPVVGPLFVYHDGSFLTREKLVAAVRLALQQAGMDASKYTASGCNNSSQGGIGGFSDQDARPMGVDSLSTLHSYPERHPCGYLRSTSRRITAIAECSILIISMLLG